MNEMNELFKPEAFNIALEDIISKLSKEAFCIICDEDDEPISSGTKNKIIRSKIYPIIKKCNVINFELITSFTIGLVFKIVIDVNEVLEQLISIY